MWGKLLRSDRNGDGREEETSAERRKEKARSISCKPPGKFGRTLFSLGEKNARKATAHNGVNGAAKPLFCIAQKRGGCRVLHSHKPPGSLVANYSLRLGLR